MHWVFQVKYFGSRDPCDYQMELGLCLLLKAPCYVAIVGFTLFHVTLFVERAAATLLLRNYEAAKPTWGLFAALGMVCATTGNGRSVRGWVRHDPRKRADPRP